jgi:hypothetical protein
VKSSSARSFGKRFWLVATGGGMFAGFLILGLPKRRMTSVMGMLVLASILMGTACGGSSSSNSSSSGTPAGSYTITVTATSGTLTQTSSVTVTVN